jgi:tetratricopeptide (TPR) repeat protein
LFRAHALAGDVSLAIIYSEKVIQLAREINHFEAEITNIHALAIFLIEQTKYAEAISYLDQGRKLVEQNHDQEWLLSMDVAAGTALYRSGDYSAAFGAFIRALGLAKSTADKHSEAEILGYLGAVQADHGLFPESITYAQSSSELAAELNEFGLVGEQQMLLAFNYHDLNQMDQAIQSCQAAIAAYEKINSASMIEKAQAFLSELHR